MKPEIGISGFSRIELFIYEWKIEKALCFLAPSTLFISKLFAAQVDFHTHFSFFFQPQEITKAQKKINAAGNYQFLAILHRIQKTWAVTPTCYEKYGSAYGLKKEAEAKPQMGYWVVPFLNMPRHPCKGKWLGLIFFQLDSKLFIMSSSVPRKLKYVSKLINHCFKNSRRFCIPLLL